MHIPQIGQTIEIQVIVSVYFVGIGQGDNHGEVLGENQIITDLFLQLFFEIEEIINSHF